MHFGALGWAEIERERVTERQRCACCMHPLSVCRTVLENQFFCGTPQVWSDRGLSVLFFPPNTESIVSILHCAMLQNIVIPKLCSYIKCIPFVYISLHLLIPVVVFFFLYFVWSIVRRFLTAVKLITLFSPSTCSSFFAGFSWSPKFVEKSMRHWQEVNYAEEGGYFSAVSEAKLEE